MYASDTSGSSYCVLLSSGVSSSSISGVVLDRNWPTDTAHIIGYSGSPPTNTAICANPGATIQTCNPGSGQFSAILNGQGAASGYNAISGMGGYATATNAEAVGQGAGANGVGSRVFGSQGEDFGLAGLDVFSSSYLSTHGDAQKFSTLLKAMTASTTPTRLSVDGGTVGSSNCINLPANSSLGFTATLLGYDTTAAGNSVAASWSSSLIDVGATASTAYYSGPAATIVSHGTGSSAAVSVSADTTRGCLNVSVTAPNSNSWKWVYQLTGAFTKR
jgi:hypothetical protein